MRFLLDTQIVLWSVAEPHRLSAPTISLLNDAAHSFHVSVVSVWETNIKYASGKLKLAQAPEIFWAESIKRLKVGVLPVTLAHTLLIHTLPAHHRDPFDRMLIAQAISDDLTVITADAVFRAYPIRVARA